MNNSNHTFLNSESVGSRVSVEVFDNEVMKLGERTLISVEIYTGEASLLHKVALERGYKEVLSFRLLVCL